MNKQLIISASCLVGALLVLLAQQPINLFNIASITLATLAIGMFVTSLKKWQEETAAHREQISQQQTKELTQISVACSALDSLFSDKTAELENRLATNAQHSASIMSRAEEIYHESKSMMTKQANDLSAITNNILANQAQNRSETIQHITRVEEMVGQLSSQQNESHKGLTKQNETLFTELSSTLSQMDSQLESIKEKHNTDHQESTSQIERTYGKTQEITDSLNALREVTFEKIQILESKADELHAGIGIIKNSQNQNETKLGKLGDAITAVAEVQKNNQKGLHELFKDNSIQLVKIIEGVAGMDNLLDHTNQIVSQISLVSENLEALTKQTTEEGKVIADLQHKTNSIGEISISTQEILTAHKDSLVNSLSSLSHVQAMISSICLSKEQDRNSKCWESKQGQVTKLFEPGRLQKIIDPQNETEILFQYNEAEQTVTSDTNIKGKLRYRNINSVLGCPVTGWEFDDRGKVKVEFSYDKMGQLKERITN
jgi:hypothetical protein